MSDAERHCGNPRCSLDEYAHSGPCRDSSAEQHVELSAAIDELATTAVMSRDEATILAMKYPDPGFLRFVARTGGTLRFVGPDALWVKYHTPPHLSDPKA